MAFLANQLLAVVSMLAAIALALLVATIACLCIVAAFFIQGGDYGSLPILDAFSSPPVDNWFARYLAESPSASSRLLALGAIIIAVSLGEALSNFYPTLIAASAVVGWALVTGLLSWILIPILARRG